MGSSRKDGIGLFASQDRPMLTRWFGCGLTVFLWPVTLLRLLFSVLFTETFLGVLLAREADDVS